MNEALLAALGLPGLAAVLTFARVAWGRCTRYRVGVREGERRPFNGARGCTVVVYNFSRAFVVATVNLAAEDADEQLIQAKVTAKDRARQLNGISS